MSRIIVHTDGASRGNPGQASIAFVIQGLGDHKIVAKKAIGQYSNNQAEYRALLAALDRLLELNVQKAVIDLFADSELMIRQITGQYRVKDANLKPVFAEAIEKITALKRLGNTFSFTAVRRESNQLADRLANEALDEQ